MLSRGGRNAAIGALATLVSIAPIALTLMTPQRAGAAGSPNISLSEAAPGTILYGTDATVSLQAANPGGGVFGYNLTFEDILPTAVSYVAGSTTPATAGGPQILANQPVAGQTTLIWSNVGDLSPGSASTLTFGLRAATDVAAPPFLLPNNSYTDNSSAYVNTDPRFLPAFSANGTPTGGSFTGSATASGTTTLSPIAVTKSEPSPERELMRGVHDHQTVFTIVVTNNAVHATNGITIDDWVPAGIEFLRCGQSDNTSNAPTNPGGVAEYAGSPLMSGHVGTPASCTAPTLVSTVVTDPDGAGPLPSAVYTHIQWTGLGNLGVSATLTLTYVAAIPIRENTMTWSGATPTGASLGQAANLDNNNGPETTDEQQLTNGAAATGTYAGVLGSGLNPVMATAYATVTAEDLATQKTISDPVFAAGKVVTFTINVETSEYRFADAAVLTDTLPSGLCPLGAVNYDAHASPECAPSGPMPSPAYSAVIENLDGTFTITWNLGHLDVSTTQVITLPAVDRGAYQANNADTTPTLGNDGITNNAAVIGNLTVRCGNGDINCTLAQAPIDHDGALTVNGVTDATTAGQSASGPAITKSVSQNVGAGVSLNCAAATYLTSASVGYPPLYQRGDRVCFRLHVAFPTGTEFRDPTVNDFIPPNTAYEAASQATTGASTVPAVVFTQSGTDLTWTMGNPLVPPNGSVYVSGGSAFEVDFSVIATSDPTVGNTFDLTQNLAKLVTSDTAGSTFTVRDMATFKLAAPILSLTKAVTFINGAAAPTPKNDTVRGADSVTYQLTINDTGLVDAYDTEVWDVLPPQENCAQVSAITPASGVCDAPTNTIKWPITAVPHVLAGGSATVGFTLQIRADAGAGETFHNVAGVRSFVGHHNNSGQPDTTYFPAANIDGAVGVGSQNAPAAGDSADVITAGALLVKTRTTSITTAGNTNTDATVGEDIAYSIDLTVPHNTTFYTASLADPLGTQHAYTAGSGLVTPPGGPAVAEGSAIPGGFTYAYSGGTNTVTFTFPAVYANATAADEHFTIAFSTVVAAVGLNTRAATITNVATLTDHTSTGGTITAANPPANTQVVEPAMAINKTVGAARAQPGGTATYSITLTNQALAGASSAFDLAGTDTIPAGLTYVAASVALSGPAAGVASQAAGVITWSVAGPLAPGQVDTVTFQVQPNASGTLGTGHVFANTATLTSWNGVSGGGAGTRSYGPISSLRNLTMDFPTPSTAKTMPGGNTAFATQSFNWRVTVTNTATVAIATSLAIGDTLPPNWSYDAGSTSVTPPIGVVTHPDPVITPNAGGDQLAWPGLGTLQPGQSLRVDYTATPSIAARTTPGTGPANPHTNSASAMVTDNTGASGNLTGSYVSNTATAQAFIGLADLSLTKTHVGNFSAGAGGAYTLTVHNAGPSTASAPITVTDAMVAPETFVSAAAAGWVCGYNGGTLTVTCTQAATLNSGASSVPITLTVNTPSGTPDGTTVTNMASVSSPTFDNSLANNTAGDPTTVRANADLVMSKTHVGTFTAGSQGTYTVSVHNAGTSDALGPLTVTDSMPGNEALVSAGGGATGWTCAAPVANVFTCTNPSGLTNGSTSSALPITVSISPSQAPGTIGNTASVTSPTTDPTPGNNSQTDNTTIVSSADIAITKVHAGTFVAGQNGVYDITVTNTAGLSDAAGPITMTDTLPAGEAFVSGGGGATGWGCSAVGAAVTCTHAANLAVGASAPFTLTVSLASGVVVATLTNTATSSSASTPDPAPGNNSSTDIAGTSQFADLQVVKNHAGAFVAGTNATYTIAVSDNGPSDAAGPVTVADTLPAGETYVGFVGAGWACGSVGAAVTCTHAAAVVSGAPATQITMTVHVAPDVLAQTLTNTATVSSSTTDPSAANNTSVDAVSSSTSADLGIVKGDTGGFVAGTTGHYTLAVTNSGPSDAQATNTVTDTLPAGLSYQSFSGTGWACSALGQVVTCTSVAAVATGASAPVITLAVGVSASLASGTVTNTAQVASPTTDPNPLNNDTTRVTSVATSADLAVTKTHAGNFPAGSDGTYAITVTNNGPSDAALPITVTDALPVAMTLVSAGGGPSWNCSMAGNTATCTAVSALAPGTSAPAITVTAHVPSGQPAAIVINGAIVTGATSDPIPGNNAASDSTALVVDADMSITKVHQGTFVAGNPGTYVLTATNHGPSDAAGPLTVADILPVGETFTSAAGTNWVCTPTAGTVTCTHAAGITVGASAETISLVVDVSAGASGTIVNSVTAGSASFDPDLLNNTGSDSVAVAFRSDLSLLKTHAGAFTAGLPAVYVLTVTNNGPSDSGSPLTVVDTLPTGESYVIGQGTNWTCAASGQTVTCTLAAAIATSASDSGLRLTVTVASGAVGSLTNGASVRGPHPDGTPVNDDAADTATSNRVFDLLLRKTLVVPLQSGRPGVYLLSVTNDGPSDSATPIVVTDTLPPGLAYRSSDGGGGGAAWSCAPSGQRATCSDITPLVSGTSTDFQLTADVNVLAGRHVFNTATVSAPGESDPGNDVGGVDGLVMAAPDVPDTGGTPRPAVPGVLTVLLGVALLAECRRRRATR